MRFFFFCVYKILHKIFKFDYAFKKFNNTPEFYMSVHNNALTLCFV